MSVLNKCLFEPFLCLDLVLECWQSFCLSFVHWFILLIFSSSSLAFYACPQTTSLMVTGKFGCLHQVLFGTPELFCLKHGSFRSGASTVSTLPCTGGRTAEHVLGSAGSLTWAVDCVWQTESIQVYTQLAVARLQQSNV